MSHHSHGEGGHLFVPAVIGFLFAVWALLHVFSPVIVGMVGVALAIGLVKRYFNGRRLDDGQAPRLNERLPRTNTKRTR